MENPIVKRGIILVFGLLALVSLYFGRNISFTFTFDQFFPKEDKDLDNYRSFIKEFESDDNFILVAIENKPTVFDSSFLARFHQFSLDVRKIPFVKSSKSLTQIDAPIKTPFGFSTIPLIHLTDPNYYEIDREKILEDPRFVNSMIDSNAQSLTVVIKTTDNIDINESKSLIAKLDSLILNYGYKDKSHLMGRAYFQKELVEFQKQEMLISFVASIILVTIIMFLLYRKWIGILIALGSITLGLLLFIGYLGFQETKLTALSALFPIIMLIVGASDVIHIFSKYVDELKSGKKPNDAMKITIHEIGLATFLTSVTTAIGFLSLTTSSLQVIQDFGVQAAIGVMIAYITVILFTTTVLRYFDADQITKITKTDKLWDRILERISNAIFQKRRTIFGIALVSCIVFCYGINLITTDYNLKGNLPKDSRVLEDFEYFEEKYAGFRPIEFAITINSDNTVEDYDVMQTINKLENKLLQYPEIKSTFSLTTLHKSAYKALNGNQRENYIFPPEESSFLDTKRIVNQLLQNENTVLVDSTRTKTRISARINDVGVDRIKKITSELDNWINKNIDSSQLTIKQTGIGMILDKNGAYVTKNLIQGLGLSILVISILMGLMFRSLTMTLVALIPNLLPLLFAGAIIGFCNIELEAGVSIMFVIVFGISVDDTIHFLGRYKVCLSKGMEVAGAINQTIQETGKAIIFTSIILFFGFFIMIFSKNPPTFTVGLLISITLIGALICDLFLLPALLLQWDKRKQNKVST